MNIFHCVEDHPTNDPRIKRAQGSWIELYRKHKLIPAHLDVYAFHSGMLGDLRKLPSLKDVLRCGVRRATSPDDIVMLTNGDTLLHPELPELLKSVLVTQGAVCSFRVNVETSGTRWLVEKPEIIAAKHKRDYGRDLFAFTCRWLTQFEALIPEMFLGEWEWDLIMTLLIRLSLGIETCTTKELGQARRSELPLGYVMHEKHVPQWQRRNMLENPGKLWNRTQARAWYEDNHLKHLYTLG